MKVLVQNELTKAIRKLSKLKSMAGITSAVVKDKLVFKKKTTLRRIKKLHKLSVIRNFKINQRKTME
jgi:DNA-binding Lrp family transcriptional regulator